MVTVICHRNKNLLTGFNTYAETWIKWTRTAPLVLKMAVHFTEMNYGKKGLWLSDTYIHLIKSVLTWELSTKCFTLHMHAKPWSPNISMCILSIVFSVFPTKLFQRISLVIFHSFVHSFITCLFDEAVKLWGEFNNGVYWGTGSLNAVLPISKEVVNYLCSLVFMNHFTRDYNQV